MLAYISGNSSYTDLNNLSGDMAEVVCGVSY